MKHVVVKSELRGSDIKPPKMFTELRDLSIQEAKRFFGEADCQAEAECPACGCAEKRPVFLRYDFRYNLCLQCESVYVSPRPSAGKLAEYQRNSQAVQFRARRFLEKTGEARRYHVLRSMANWLGRLVDEVGNHSARSYADIGTNYPFLFDEIRGLGLFDAFHAVEPLPPLEEACRERGASVLQADPSGLGAATAFEQLEHVWAPLDYLRRVRTMLAEGGMVFLTTRTISGFDLQVLWDKTPYIYVPEHLNLLSIEGISQLLERAGFDLVELSTPGQLDLELTAQAAEADPSIELPSFVRYMLAHRGPDTREDFQTFLQKNRLSSHVRVAAVRKEE